MSDQRTTAADSAALGTGTGWTLLAALGFAAVSTLTSLATGEKVSLFTVLTWRYTLGAVVMVTWVSTRAYNRMPWKEALRFIVLGGGGQALLVGLALSSLQYITAATLGFLFYTYPAWVTLVQALRGAERLSVRRIVALALSFGGIVVIVFQLADGGTLELAQFAGSGKAHGIELKSEKGKLSMPQQLTHDALKRAGIDVAVCRSIDEVAIALSNWGVVYMARTIDERGKCEHLVD